MRRICASGFRPMWREPTHISIARVTARQWWSSCNARIYGLCRYRLMSRWMLARSIRILPMVRS